MKASLAALPILLKQSIDYKVSSNIKKASFATRVNL